MRRGMQDLVAVRVVTPTAPMIRALDATHSGAERNRRDRRHIDAMYPHPANLRRQHYQRQQLTDDQALF